MRGILVTGASGQIGSELIPALRARYGNDRVVASDIRVPPRDRLSAEGGFEHVDCTHIREIEHSVRRHDVGTIYHLAALLSAVAEDKPRVAWEVNMGGLYRVLEVARQVGCAVFFPSSIGAFGPRYASHGNTPGHGSAAHDDLRCHQGLELRAAVRLLPRALRTRHAGSAPARA